VEMSRMENKDLTLSSRIAVTAATFWRVATQTYGVQACVNSSPIFVSLYKETRFNSRTPTDPWTGAWRLQNRCSIPGSGRDVSPLHRSSVCPVSSPMATGSPLSGVKGQGRQTDNSRPSSVKLTMLGAVPPLPHTWKQLCFNLYELLLLKRRGEMNTGVFWVMTRSSLAV
jgi:hypothetical protein